jgi:hypothetical protein
MRSFLLALIEQAEQGFAAEVAALKRSLVESASAFEHQQQQVRIFSLSINLIF